MKLVEKIMLKQSSPNTAAPITIAFFGDSVTQGCFELYQKSDDIFETEYRVADGYHTKLRHLFELCYPNVPINMIHAGISGGNVTTGLARVERDVIAFHPDLTIVCFGLNDCTGGAERVTYYENVLKELLQKLKESDTEVIFMTPNLLADKITPEVGNEAAREKFARIPTHYDNLLLFMESARKVCNELDVPLCDCCRKWEILKKNGVNTNRLLSNRLNHPIEEMHWMFAVSLFEMIQGM